MSHRDWMAIARKEADRAAAAGDVPVGALVVLDGRIVGRGHNLREAVPDPTGHAEIVALRDAARALGRWRLSGCTLYVTLEPCPMCAWAIAQSRVDRLVYGALDPKVGAAGTVLDLVAGPLARTGIEVLAGIDEAACRYQLDTFFAGRRSGKLS
jgi:tRNA(adenine34) deaminase